VRYLVGENTGYVTKTQLELQVYKKNGGTILYDNFVEVFEFTDWNDKEKLPNANDNFFQIIKVFNYAKNWTPLIACSDGVRACGLFVVLSYILEKCEIELEIDVCNAIRIARRSGKNFVNNSVMKKLLRLNSSFQRIFFSETTCIYIFICSALLSRY
jgi:protein tyrosine phosphatase